MRRQEFRKREEGDEVKNKNSMLVYPTVRQFYVSSFSSGTRLPIACSLVATLLYLLILFRLVILLFLV